MSHFYTDLSTRQSVSQSVCQSHFLQIYKMCVDDVIATLSLRSCLYKFLVTFLDFLQSDTGIDIAKLHVWGIVHLKHIVVTTEVALRFEYLSLKNLS